MSPGRIPDEQYKAYIKLQNLSRRARYIVHEDIKLDDGSRAFLTHDAHLKKAFKNLDILLSFFNTLYSLAIPEMNIVCQGLKQTELAFFKI